MDYCIVLRPSLALPRAHSVQPMTVVSDHPFLWSPAQCLFPAAASPLSRACLSYFFVETMGLIETMGLYLETIFTDPKIPTTTDFAIIVSVFI